MIKNTLILTLLMLLVWVSRDYFSIVLPDNEPIKYEKVKVSNNKNQNLPKENTQKNTHIDTIKTKEIEITEKTTSKRKNKIKVLKKSKKADKLSLLLSEGKFYDALMFYLDNNSGKNMKKMQAYLANLASSNPKLALEYMQAFLDDVPYSDMLSLMIKIHINQGSLLKAIGLIKQAKENYSSEFAVKRLSVQLKEISIRYIEELVTRKEHASLIAFLEEMSEYEPIDTFYAYRLSELYMDLGKVSEASMLLEELRYDDTYAQKAQVLLKSIEEEGENDKNYKYAIPLQKYGKHFTVNVILDGSTFTLMLDTGATFILIDEDKAPMLKILRDDLIMHTVGGDVAAKLREASSMRVGNLELSNIKISTAAFKSNDIDGLLGMNFFRQFKFFIDQNQAILYLDPK